MCPEILQNPLAASLFSHGAEGMNKHFICESMRVGVCEEYLMVVSKEKSEQNTKRTCAFIEVGGSK
jgi:hypothetical protein